MRCFVLALVMALLGVLPVMAQHRASEILKGQGEDPPVVETTADPAPQAEAALPERPEREPAQDSGTAAGESAASEDSPVVEPVTPGAFVPWRGGRAHVVSVPITDVISSPNEYVLRRALKMAIEEEADALILEIDTPGGSVATLLEMMGHIDRFDDHGITIAYINDEAISAGALLAAVTDEIWYSPKAVIGSAGVVAGSGQEIPDTMRQKVESYVQAKIRALSGNHRYRADVIRAMMNEDFELRVGDEVISPEGRMLNLTAEEALTKYGDPPAALFGNGMAPTLEDLLDDRFGTGNWELSVLEVTWSEELAKYLTKIGPLLVAFGILAVFIEMKSPGFGIFGVAGVLLLGTVFATNYIMGLAGWEPFIVLVAGLVLIAIEIFLLPGTFIFMVTGAVMVIGSILWSLTDVWPTIDGGREFELESLIEAATSLSLAVLIGTVASALLWRLLPNFGLFDRFVLQNRELATTDGMNLSLDGSIGVVWPEAGATGVVLRPLRPSGEVEIDGKRYEARVETGVVGAGERIVVVRRLQFGLEVCREGES